MHLIYNRYFLGVILTLGILLLLGSKAEAQVLVPEDLPQVYEEVLKPSVRIDSNCSGTIINNKKNPDGTQSFDILTAKHCMTKKPLLGESHVIEIPVVSNNILHNYVPVVSNLKAMSGMSDIAILEVKSAQLSFDVVSATVPMNIGLNQDLYYGRNGYTISYGAARGPVLTTGYLGYQEYIPELKMFAQRATCPTIGGSSGSGLFIKENGKYVLVGTLTGGWGESFNFYTTLLDIQILLASTER